MNNFNLEKVPTNHTETTENISTGGIGPSINEANDINNINYYYPNNLLDTNQRFQQIQSLDRNTSMHDRFHRYRYDDNFLTTSDVDDESDTASQVSSRPDSDNLNVREGKRPESITTTNSSAAGGVTNKMSSKQTNKQRVNRSRKSKLDIKLDKINLEFDIFPANDIIAFRLLLLVQDIEILDNIKTSAWHKFLTHMHPDKDTKPREGKSNMIRFELNSIRSIPSEPVEEFRIKVCV